MPGAGCATAGRSSCTACRATWRSAPTLCGRCRRRRALSSRGWRASDPSPWSSRCYRQPISFPRRRTPSSVTSFSGATSSARPIRRFLEWLGGPAARQSSAEQAQRRFAFLKLAIQRRDHAIRPLQRRDLAAQRERDRRLALRARRGLGRRPLLAAATTRCRPVICYLDRGIGAAIRRARTRLPGGGATRSAIIRMPRERMIGSGIASSLIHEVGHQARGPARPGRTRCGRSCRRLQRAGRDGAGRGELWERWISEIVADFWSVARLGIASTIGLMGVVSLPRAFVFRAQYRRPASRCRGFGSS